MAEKDNKSLIREADNKVTIEGVLKENNLQLKTKDGKNMILGDLVIETAENELHTVKFLAMEKKADGSDNGLFKSLKTVMEEYKSVAGVGEEEADKVRITSGKLSLNEYYINEELKSYQQISSNFVNKVQGSDAYNPRAEFEVEVYIQGLVNEVVNNEETGRLIINAFIPMFGGSVIPFKFIVDDEDVIGGIRQEYSKNDTVKLYGDLKSTVVTKTEIVGSAIGKGKEKITKSSIKEFIVTGGDLPYEDENTKKYTLAVIKSALAERDIKLADLKKKKENGGKTPAKNGQKAIGKKTDSKSATGTKTKTDSAPANKGIVAEDDDLPF